MEIILFNFAIGFYTFGMVLYLGYAFSRKEAFPQWARWALMVAVLFHLASLGMRTVEARLIPGNGWYVPWSNWFESFSFFALVITVQFLVLISFRSLPILGAFVSPLAFFCLMVALSGGTGRQIPVLPDELRSVWMIIHVPLLFFSYAGFALAFGLGLAYLLQQFQLKSKRPSHLMFRLPALDELDGLVSIVIGLSFPLLTLGLFFGSIWAFEEWGRFWNWDSKEIWALISWLVYAGYLFARHGRGWRGRKTAYLSLVGFCFVLFTYVGVNYISERHGYLTPSVQKGDR